MRYNLEMAVKDFASWDEAQKFMAESEKAANARILPAQLEIGWGDCWVEYDQISSLWIFGKVFTREAGYASSIAAGASPNEAELEQVDLDDAYRRGYRFGKAYSVACPEGELGDTHISQMLSKLEPLEFVAARDRDWDFDQIVDAGVGLHNMAGRIIAQEHARRQVAADHDSVEL
jgi:hypothetical protein